MSCVYILGREYYKHFIYNNKTLIYEFCYFVFGAHAVVCVTCACAVFSTSRQFYSTESEKLPTKKKKHRPPLPPSMSEQFYVLSVVHFEWMWLIFSFSVIL